MKVDLLEPPRASISRAARGAPQVCQSPSRPTDRVSVIFIQRTRPFLRVTILGRFPFIKNLPTQRGDCGRTRKGGCSERSLRDASVYKRNALQNPRA